MDLLHQFFDQRHLRCIDLPLRLHHMEEFRSVDFGKLLWIVEMTIVTRPFVLDFAGAYLDERPDYPDRDLGSVACGEAGAVRIAVGRGTGGHWGSSSSLPSNKGT